MENNDYRLYLEEKFAALNTHMNAQFVVINDKLEEINQHVQKTNGRVTELEKKTTALEVKDITHVMNCPNAAKIRTLEDNTLSQKTIRKWIVGAIGITGGIIGIVWIIIQIYFKTTA